MFDGDEEGRKRVVAASRSARGFSAPLEERLVADGKRLRWMSSDPAIEGSGWSSGTVDCPEPVLMCP